MFRENPRNHLRVWSGQSSRKRGHMCPGTLEILRIFLFFAVYFVFQVPKVTRHKINFWGTGRGVTPKFGIKKTIYVFSLHLTASLRGCPLCLLSQVLANSQLQLLPGGGHLVSKISFLYFEGRCPVCFIDKRLLKM